MWRGLNFGRTAASSGRVALLVLLSVSVASPSRCAAGNSAAPLAEEAPNPRAEEAPFPPLPSAETPETASRVAPSAPTSLEEKHALSFDSALLCVLSFDLGLAHGAI